MLLNDESRNVRKIGEQCENIDKMKEDRIPVHQNGWRNQWLRQRWTILHVSSCHHIHWTDKYLSRTSTLSMSLHEEFWDVINAEQCEHIDHMKDNPFPVYQKIWVGTTQWSWYHMRVKNSRQGDETSKHLIYKVFYKSIANRDILHHHVRHISLELHFTSKHVAQ